MPRIRPVEYKDATEAARATHDAVVHDHGRMTNMKATLLHSLPAFQALMEWYSLRDDGAAVSRRASDDNFLARDISGNRLPGLLDILPPNSERLGGGPGRASRSTSGRRL